MKQIVLALLVAVAAGCQTLGLGSSPETAASESAAAAVVDQQVEAYNRHDLDAFLRLYARNARIYLHPNEVVTSGTEQLRARYRQQWSANPSLRVRVTERMVQGNFVIDQEQSVGWADGRDVRVVAIYEIRNGRIQNVWFIR